MADRETASVLTDRQRRWFRDNDTPPNPGNTRSRIYKRLRKIIETDGELLASELRNEELNAREVAKDFTRTELVNGISGMVAALYLIGREGDRLDVEKAINSGIHLGREGRKEYLESRASDDPYSLTLAEWGELEKLNPEFTERVRQQRKQHDETPNSYWGPPEELQAELGDQTESGE